VEEPTTKDVRTVGRALMGPASACTPLGVRKPTTMLAFWQAESLELMREEISLWGVSKRTVAFMKFVL